MVEPNATQDGTSGGTAPASGGAPASSDNGSGTQATPSGSGDSGSQDYPGKIRAGGDFAWEEVRAHQSRADKAESELQKIGRIRELLSAGESPDLVVGARNAYYMLRGDPRFRKVCEHLETHGELPKGASDSRWDDGDDLDESSPEDQKFQQLSDQQRDLTVSMARNALTGHLDRFFQDYSLDEGARERVTQQLQQNVQQWARMGDHGLKSVNNITSPEGYKFVRTTLLGMLSEKEIDEGRERARSAQRDTVRRFATDGPSDRGTTGREVPADVRESLKGKGALEALRFYRENADRIGGYE